MKKRADFKNLFSFFILLLRLRDCFKLFLLLEIVHLLPATVLVSNCYDRMFASCSSLNYIKVMFTTNPSASYLQYWVENISSTGTFVMNAAAEWDPEDYRCVNSIPEGWTVEKVTA